MKCTFSSPDATSCSRCTPGGYECVFPGRKPRSPGVRTVLRHQLREKDAQVDELLDQINPPSATATPLGIVPSRLLLTPSERVAHREVLTWLERSAVQNLRAGGESRAKFDISSLEEGADSDVDSDEDNLLDIGSVRGSSPSGSSCDRIQSLPEESTPAGLLATSSFLYRRSKLVAGLPEGVRLAAESGEGFTYFLPGPAANLDLRRLIVERQSAPEILLSGLVTTEDVQNLFQIYFQRINSFVVLLDENIHTPTAVLSRCPLLFTVVCAVASKYYDEKPAMYQMAMHFAKAAAATAIIDGWKTIETCQAFILLSVFGPPVKRMEEDRAWCYTGIAFRLASELNLGRNPTVTATDEREERELLNKSRAWLICFLIDRCFSIQMGKPWMIPEDDTIRSASNWCSCSKYQNRYDVWLASMAELMSITSRFTAAVHPAFGNKSGESEDVDVATIQKVYAAELDDFSTRIAERHAEDFGSSDPTTSMQMILMQCIFHYCRLVVVSYGFQQTLMKGIIKAGDESLATCLQAASSVITATINGFARSGFMRYCPEIVFAQCAYAAALLLRCLEPTASGALDFKQEKRIVGLVQRLSITWTSGELANDKKHCAKPYIRLLQRQLEPHTARLIEVAKKSSSAVDVPAQSGFPKDLQISEPSGVISIPGNHPSGWNLASHEFAQPTLLSNPTYTTSWDEVYATSDGGQSHKIGFGGSYVGGTETDYLHAVLDLPENTWCI
ncbi:hypothetical protein OBBRIDRAFT_814001 [Obba rivulosa]|uniref:Xylanolytic transcriptional activator regulatory domain-containing protein n=1 Tax=Obba rivulosa TaxID=1052685 RepID=A0A8E2AN18_9APHY|nr:hypothetical protein OBBRIDRAFT_814001 [Obba rivulosa]